MTLMGCHSPVTTVSVAKNGKSVAFGMTDGLVGQFDYDNKSPILNSLNSLFTRKMVNKVVEDD